MSGWSETEIETAIEIEEEFCATLESIKSEEERQDDIKLAELPEKYVAQRIEGSSRFSERTWQSNDDVSSSMRCRLCAIPNDDMVDIFSSDKTEDILEKVQYSLPIVVTKTNTLPKQICGSCLEELERCYRFHKIVVEADKQLHAVDKLASMKSEETDTNCDSFPTYNAQAGSTQYDNIDGPLETVSDIETNKNRVAIIPVDAQTPDTAVKRNDLLSSLKPCSVVLSIIESCSNMEKEIESPSDTDYKNLVSTTEILDSGSTAVAEISQRSVRHSEKQLMIPVIHAPTYISEQRYKCNTCAKTFKWKYRLTEHCAVHMDEGLKPHKCNTCAKTFRCKYSLTRHSAVHMDGGLKRHECNTCAKTFRCKYSLTRHSAVHMDGGLKRHECNTCAKTFRWKYSLTQHSAVHMDEGLKRHKCNTCAKTFRWKCDLTNHIRIHTNKGLYNCEYCGKKFVNRTHRDCHVRIHTNERPFRCPTCDKSFTNPSSLKRHSFVHLEERKFHLFCVQ